MDDYHYYDTSEYSTDYVVKKDKRLEKELKRKKDNKKETKMWHWIMVDIILGVILVASFFMFKLLYPVLGIVAYIAPPLMLLLLLLSFSFVPAIPSGIRSFFEWILAKIIITVIAILLIYGVNVEEATQASQMIEGIVEKIVENRGRLTSEDAREVVGNTTEESVEENSQMSETENGQETN